MERVTVFLPLDVVNYQSVVESLKEKFDETGEVSPVLIGFIQSCLQHFGPHNIPVPESSGEFQLNSLQLTIRPSMAIVGMQTPPPKFREKILEIAREFDLSALDHQNGFIHVPTSSPPTRWWKIW